MDTSSGITSRLILSFFLAGMLVACGGDRDGTIENDTGGVANAEEAERRAETPRVEAETYRVPFDGSLPTVTSLPNRADWPTTTSEGTFPVPSTRIQSAVLNGRLWLYDSERTQTLTDPSIPPNSAWVTGNGSAWVAVDAPVPRPERSDYSVTGNGKMVFLLGGSYLDTLYRGLSDVWSTRDGLDWTRVTANATSGGLAVAGFSEWRGRFYVTGGFDQNTRTWYDNVWTSTDGTDWVVEASGVFDGRQLGGHQILAGTTHLYLVRPDGGIFRSSDGRVWESIPAFTAAGEELGYPPARWDQNAVWFHDRLVILGGLHQTDLYETPIPATDVWASPDGEQWERIAPDGTLPARSNMIATVYKDRIFLIGGYEEGRRGEPREWKREVWVSDDAATWHLLAQDPSQQETGTR